MSRPQVLVIGAGPAGLMAAEVIARADVAVTILDRMPSVGRKLLMAGRGGLNLTHSEPLPRLLDRYGPAAEWLEPALAVFPPAAVIAWCEGLGESVFTGSSGRVFPTRMKASPLLRAWLGRLAGLGVQFRLRHRWLGAAPDGQRFETSEGMVTLAADATVLALGGASWPRLGSDGAWTGLLPSIAIAPLCPANSGVVVAWSAPFRRFEGEPLKRLAVRFGGQVVRGEAMVTAAGLEGGAIYALCAPIRAHLATHPTATLHIDLRPDLDEAALAGRLDQPRRGQSLSTFLRKAAGLSPAAVGLLQEALHDGSDDTPLAALIKAVPVRVGAIQPIARAISTAGGIALTELDANLMLRHRPGWFAAGEMLDWEAPTGGYLLQACLSTGAAAGQGALSWLAIQPRATRAAS